jgi:hypothetical protein
MEATIRGGVVFKRVVTGHDHDGRAVIVSDAPPTGVHQVGGPGGPTFVEVWSTLEAPAVIERQASEPRESGLVLAPPKRGTRLRVIDFPPETEASRRMMEVRAAAAFTEMGGADAASAGAGAPHPLMHRTQTVDYGIVLQGELTLVLDRGEATVRAGDIIIQQGTNHAWANRSGETCRVAFVLIDGRFADGVRS